MGREIQTKVDPVATFNISLGSLANGSSRQSDMVDNTLQRPAMLVYIALRAGAAPTAGAVYEVYLLRGDAASPNYRTDGAGASDAAITIVNAMMIGTIVVTNTSGGLFYGDFDTAPLGPLGPEFGIAVKNSSGQSLNATNSQHTREYALYLPDIQ